ncbi:BLUF domain-containing protein [Haloferula sp. BvORR071]|uniref:BLUF domain-containing protein n=1 Tax=Haloferula sp. BvORR071 TaxID=1396141 RepID=UPI0006984CAD|nr:BLUF domain-containing protein [Haloferula sp. BvORR071]
MFQLIYVSTAARPMEAADLRAILGTARERNAELEITGMLVFHSGHFVQVLEGDETAVRGLLADIRSDGRHRNLRVIDESHHAVREFSDWSMAFRDLSLSSASAAGFSEFLNEPTDPMPRRASPGTKSNGGNDSNLSTSAHVLQLFRKALADPLAVAH